MFKPLLTAGAVACLCSTAALAAPAPLITIPPTCSAGTNLSAADYATFKAALAAVIGAPDNKGLGFNMWATIVAKDGTVTAPKLKPFAVAAFCAEITRLASH